MSWKDRMVVLAIAICAAGVVACGGSGGDGADEASAEEARLKFAECMREHGVDMPDPEPGGGFLMKQEPQGAQGEGGTSRSGPGDDPATREAMASCEKFLAEAGPRDFSPEQRQEFQEAALEFAQCMREHGVDMPDPQFGGDGKVTMTMKAPRRDGAAEAAQEACQGKMPAPPGGAPGAAAPAP